MKPLLCCIKTLRTFFMVKALFEGTEHLSLKKQGRPLFKLAPFNPFYIKACRITVPMNDS